jgi:hypothetical protein
MYCPNCSTRVSLDQKFCRSCGFGLEKIAEAVSEQHPSQLAQNLREQKNKLERLGVLALSIFGIGVIGFFLYMVGDKVISLFAQGKTLAALGLIGLTIVLGCGLLSVILFAKAKEVQELSTKRRLQDPQDLQKPGATAKLLQENTLEPIPSVTEHSTELLFTEKRSGSESN